MHTGDPSLGLLKHPIQRYNWLRHQIFRLDRLVAVSLGLVQIGLDLLGLELKQPTLLLLLYFLSELLFSLGRALFLGNFRILRVHHAFNDALFDCVVAACVH